jgi:hypothetical protein
VGEYNTYKDALVASMRKGKEVGTLVTEHSMKNNELGIMNAVVEGRFEGNLKMAYVDAKVRPVESEEEIEIQRMMIDTGASRCFLSDLDHSSTLTKYIISHDICFRSILGTLYRLVDLNIMDARQSENENALQFSLRKIKMTTPVRKHIEFRVIESSRPDFVVIMEFISPLNYKSFDLWFNAYMSQWSDSKQFIASAESNLSQFKLQPDHNWETTPGLRRIAMVQISQRVQRLILKSEDHLQELNTTFTQMLDRADAS